MKKRRSFIFYASYYDAICDLPDEVQGRMYKAIVDYAMTQDEPILDGQLKSYFKLIKPNIDAGIRRYENGLKGGAPVGNQNASKNNPETTQKQPKNNLKTTEKQPKNNLKTTRYNQDNIKEQELEQDNEQDNEQEQEQEREQDKQHNQSVEVGKRELVDSLVKELEQKTYQTFDDIDFNPEDNTVGRFLELVYRVANEPEIKINKSIIPNYKVLRMFYDLFIGDKFIVRQRFYETFEIIDSKPNIANKYKYAVGVFYNKACGY